MKHPVPDFEESFAKLIAVPTISSVDPELDQGNRVAVDLLANWLEGLGFRIELQPLPGKPDKANLIACLGRGEGGLVLSGHMDTVPCDPGRWRQDPFLLTGKDGRYYGLGTSDMKCFFPLVIETIRRMDLQHLRQPLYIIATADEESTMSGVQALVDSGRPLGRYALIGEPTGLKPVYKHKGVLIESIRLTGTAGHSSDPALGVNALEGMHAVMTALLEWRTELQQQHVDKSFHVPVPTLNLGSIRGGDNPNRICGECTLNMDLRLIPEMDIKTVRMKLHAVVHQALQGSGLEIEICPIFHGLPAMHTDAGSEIVRMAEKISGHAAESVAFGTEGPYLNSMGMETVILGPGNIEQAHQANEYIAMDRISPMLDILNNMIGHFCIEEMKHVDRHI